MNLTRRAFTTAAATTVTLTVLGCGKDNEKPAPADADRDAAAAADAPKAPGEKPAGLPRNIDVPTAAFIAGSLDDYRKPGVHDEHWLKTGVYLFSDGETLVAILSTCTHNGCAVRWDAENRHYECPCHESQFDSDGRVRVEGQKAEYPLIRLGIRVIENNFGKQVEVDPTQEFDEPNWEKPGARIDLTTA